MNNNNTEIWRRSSARSRDGSMNLDVDSKSAPLREAIERMEKAKEREIMEEKNLHSLLHVWWCSGQYQLPGVNFIWSTKRARRDVEETWDLQEKRIPPEERSSRRIKGKK